VIGLAVLLGCFLGWQFWLIWSLHNENAQLQAQVARLSGTVCLYQQAAVELEMQLIAHGLPAIPGTALMPCPPPGG
jgi:hypothetical protein